MLRLNLFAKRLGWADGFVHYETLGFELCSAFFTLAGILAIKPLCSAGFVCGLGDPSEATGKVPSSVLAMPC